MLEEPELSTKDTEITDLQEDFKEMKFDRSNFGKYVGKIGKKSKLMKC